MVDSRGERRDVLKLKRCAEEMLKGVKKRPKPDDGSRIELAPKPPQEPPACDRQLTPQVCPIVSPFSREREAHEVTHHVFKEVRKWLSRVPPLFWVAVSLPHMMAYIYWLSVDLMNTRANPCPLDLARRLARWLKPLLREFPSKQIEDFLVKTGLDLVVNAYFGIQLWAGLQSPPVCFSNDYGRSAAFDPDVHWNADLDADQGFLRAGNECLVIFPAMGTLKPLRAICKPCVLPTPTPNCSLREWLRRSERGARSQAERAADYAWLMETLETPQQQPNKPGHKRLDVESDGADDSVLLLDSSSPD